MASRVIQACADKLQVLYGEFKRDAENLGIHFILTCTARTIAEQRALYARGRESLSIVNEKYKVVGLAPITAEENKRCVTWTLNSKHIVGLDREKAEAFDIVTLNRRGQPIWDLKADVNEDQVSDYIQLAEIGRNVGLRAGAFFRDANGRARPDYPHFEI